VIVREIYELAIEALDSKGKAQHFWFRDSPNTLLARSVRMLELLTDVLKRLRKLAAEHAQTFRSDGFRRLLATLSVSVDLGDVLKGDSGRRSHSDDAVRETIPGQTEVTSALKRVYESRPSSSSDSRSSRVSL
jgi:hypothetical protein